MSAAPDRGRWRFAGRVGLGLLVLVLLTVNLGRYPAPWFDEGIFTSIATGLARTGEYRLPNDSGPLTYGAGPTVIVPVALALRWFGESFVVARAVILAFSIVGLLAFAAVAARLRGAGVATLATVLLVAGSREPFVSYVFLSRQVLAEVPALSLYLLGLLFLIRALDTAEPRWRDTTLAGVCWAVAIVTKPHYLSCLPPALVLIAAAGHFYYRRAWGRKVIVCGAVAAGGWALAFVFQGPVLSVAQVAANIRAFEDEARAVGVVPGYGHLRLALGSIWRSGLAWTGLLGLAWGLLCARPRTPAGARHLIALAAPCIWLVWFVWLSVGWARYAFPVYALSAIWTADLIIEIAKRLERRMSPVMSRAAVTAGVGALLVFNGRQAVGQIIHPRASGFDAMRTRLAALPAGARVETWDFQLDVGSRATMHHPDEATELLYTQNTMAGLGPPDVAPSDLDADYLVIGPFGSWTTYYRNVLKNCEAPLYQTGDYQLYRLPCRAVQ